MGSQVPCRKCSLHRAINSDNVVLLDDPKCRYLDLVGFVLVSLKVWADDSVWQSGPFTS
jgi:hypothetical protein